VNLFDPFAKAKEIDGVVAEDSRRKYYRVARPGRWYGGIASADCCGCNLKCIFCWSNKPRESPEKCGKFYTPEEIGNRIVRCAREHKYRLVRISGNEPTIARQHLLEVLRFISDTELQFILETNGTLLDEGFVNDLARFTHVHVRVSLKGTDPEEFSMLTGAIPEAFEKVMASLDLLRKYRIDFNLAVMLSFSPDKSVALLRRRLRDITPRTIEDFEEEYVILYPHVIRNLKKAIIQPLLAYTPGGLPKRLV
jgi:uncharacterized Fe-S cluster-containing radical SAM superfamily protein